MNLFLRILLLITFISIVFCLVFSQTTKTQKYIQIDGVYRFMSEKTIIKKPKMEPSDRISPEWSGFFFFSDGYFSITLMDQTREDDWFTKFPTNISEVGFESFSGRYEINKNVLLLKPEVELHPFYDSRKRTFEVEVDGDTLTLIEKLHPYTEDIREGEKIIVLSKIKTNEN